MSGQRRNAGLKKHHPLSILFFVLMVAMLLGGLAIFIHAAMHPQTAPIWVLPLGGRLG